MMQNIHRTILSCIACFVFSVNALAQQNNGPLAVPFGLYRDSVKAILLRQNCVQGFESNSYDNHYYVNYKNFYHSGDSCSLLLTFYKNKFAGYLIADYDQKKQAKSTFKHLKKDMKHQYGKPAASNNTSERKTLTWTLTPADDTSPKEISIEMVTTSGNDPEMLEQYISKEEYEWRQANPGQKMD